MGEQNAETNKKRRGYPKWSPETRQRHMEAIKRRKAEIVRKREAQLIEQKEAREKVLQEAHMIVAGTSIEAKLPANKQTTKKAEAFVTPEDFELSNKTLSEVLFEATLPKVVSDPELSQRFADYFTRCIQTSRIPTVEEALMSTGYSVHYMLKIRGGAKNPPWATSETPNIISWAMDICKTYDAKMVMAGKMPQIPYIYRSKNYYGMSDKTELQIKADFTAERDFSLEDIAKRYGIETSFADEDKQE